MPKSLKKDSTSAYVHMTPPLPLDEFIDTLDDPLSTTFVRSKRMPPKD